MNHEVRGVMNVKRPYLSDMMNLFTAKVCRRIDKPCFLIKTGCRIIEMTNLLKETMNS